MPSMLCAVWQRRNILQCTDFSSDMLNLLCPKGECLGVERSHPFLLGNAPMRTKPTPQERPEPFHRIHMDFTKAVAIFIAGVLALSMVDALMVVSPGAQAS